MRRSLSLLEQDMNTLKKIGKTNIIHFTDEAINVPLYDFKDMLRMMIRNQYGFKWYSFFRTEVIDEETVRLMKKSGCIGVLLGLESGNNSILERMNKNVTVTQLERAHYLLKEYGLNTIGFFIIGFPGETTLTIQNTIDFINKLGPTFYRCHVWECDMDTEVWNKREQYGLQIKNGLWTHETMDQKQARKLAKSMKQQVKNSFSIDQADFGFAMQLLCAGISVETIQQIYRKIGMRLEE